MSKTYYQVETFFEGRIWEQFGRDCQTLSEAKELKDLSEKQCTCDAFTKFRIKKVVETTEII